MIESRDPEKCYYCESDGEYNQLVGQEPNWFMGAVCKKHVKIDFAS